MGVPDCSGSFNLDIRIFRFIGSVPFDFLFNIVFFYTTFYHILWHIFNLKVALRIVEEGSVAVYKLEIC